MRAGEKKTFDFYNTEQRTMDDENNISAIIKEKLENSNEADVD